MLEAVRSGVTPTRRSRASSWLERPALTGTVIDAWEGQRPVPAGTPANLGYISGALKHLFDTIYYPALDQTAGRPFGVYVHGNDDTGVLRRGRRSPPVFAGTRPRHR